MPRNPNFSCNKSWTLGCTGMPRRTQTRAPLPGGMADNVAVLQGLQDRRLDPPRAGPEQHHVVRGWPRAQQRLREGAKGFGMCAMPLCPGVRCMRCRVVWFTVWIVMNMPTLARKHLCVVTPPELKSPPPSAPRIEAPPSDFDHWSE